MTEYLYEAFKGLLAVPLVSWLLLVAGAVLIISIFWIGNLLASNGRSTRATFKVETKESDQQIIRLQNESWRSSAPLFLKPGHPVRLRANGKSTRARVHFKYGDFSSEDIVLSDTVAAKLGVSDGESIEIKLIRPSIYAPLQLWNHPDTATQIGVRLGVVLSIISVIVELTAENLL